jgi:neutral ceramidase
MFKIGVSKIDTDVFAQNLPMFGYGDEKHVMKGIDLPIYSRAFVIKNETKKIALVVVELGAISDKLKNVVAGHLTSDGFMAENIMISATHTHSAVSGHFGYLLYDLTAGGFNQTIFDKIVLAIVQSIKYADKNAVPANIYFDQGQFEDSIEVVFNASMKAYNANHDVKQISADNTHLATDRIMPLFRFETDLGQAIGSINWFGVHTTSLGKDRFKMSSDNKGYAARFFEEEYKIVSAFAQKPCADTSPNFHWNAKRNKMCGKFDDDYKSAEYNGKLQYEKAREIFEVSKKNSPVRDFISYHLMHVDLSNTIIGPEFSALQEEIRTVPAALGVAFARGMTDGFGLDQYTSQLLKSLSFLSRQLSIVGNLLSNEQKRSDLKNKNKFQGNKAVLLETTFPSVLGMNPSYFAYALSPFDKIMNQLKQHIKDGSINKPWTPHILPIQLICIGSTAICGLPAEISITAGQRLEKSCLDVLKKAGIANIIIAPYSNAYAGYITTPEEYEVQAYEGGHTMFGKHTFLAFQTHFKNLCLEAVASFSKT